MRTIKIQDKLAELGVNISDIVLGEFDAIGEFTAKRSRNQNDPLFKKVGAFYRSNYERGILIYYLITTGNLDSFLEIGFGRGYGTMCAAKAFADIGKPGKIMTIDPALHKDYVQSLAKIFPEEWFRNITFVTDHSENALKEIAHEKYDFVYIDGDHRYDAVKKDWELVKPIWQKHVLFDDYHLPTKHEEAIEVARLVDSIDIASENANQKELIKLDRRIFFDDRGYTDEQIDYGQVLISRNSSSVVSQGEEEYVSDWLNDR